jgi:hypothetical protein
LAAIYSIRVVVAAVAAEVRVFLFMSYVTMVLHYYSSTSMELTGLHYYHYCYYNNNNNSYYYYYLDEVVHNNQPWRVRWSNERRTNDEPLTTNE